MKTDDLKIRIALCLESFLPRLPESWSPSIRRVAWRLIGHGPEGGSLAKIGVGDADPDVSTAQRVLIIRFVRLERDMSNEEIESMLQDRGLKSAKPEHLDALARHPEHCPDGRIIAIGGAGQPVRVLWKQGKTLNQFWFPREVSHASGDLAAGIVP